MVTLRTALALIVGTVFLHGCAIEPPANPPKNTNSSDPVAQAEPVKDKDGPAKTEPPKTTGGEKAGKDEPPLTLAKWTFSAVEQKWGLKFKSVTYQPLFISEREFPGTYTFVIEFGKDLTEKELGELRLAFEPRGQPPAPGSMSLCFFDKDDVLVERRGLVTMSGALTEMTGTKGDAFRLKTTGPNKLETVRAEVRLLR